MVLPRRLGDGVSRQGGKKRDCSGWLDQYGWA